MDKLKVAINKKIKENYHHSLKKVFGKYYERDTCYEYLIILEGIENDYYIYQAKQLFKVKGLITISYISIDKKALNTVISIQRNNSLL